MGSMLQALNPKLRNSLQNRVMAKAERDFTHALFANWKFNNLLSQQNQLFSAATYTLTFDLDFFEDYERCPLILDKLRDYKIKAGFAVIGRFVEVFPDIHKRIVDDGHELITHTLNHPDNPHWSPSTYFNLLSALEKEDEIVGCHEKVYSVTGVEMKGYRAPHFGNLHTEDVYPVLYKLGYTYSSSMALQYSKSKGEPYLHYKNIIEFPIGGSFNYPLAVFDNWNALKKRKPLFKNDEQFINEFHTTLEQLSFSNGYLTHYFDPYDLDENKFEQMLFSLESTKVDVKLYSEISEQIRSQFGDEG